MKIAYVKDGNIVVEAFTQDVEVDFPHVVIDREILEPIETWYIEDGEIKIDEIYVTDAYANVFNLYIYISYNDKKLYFFIISNVYLFDFCFYKLFIKFNCNK